MRFSPTRSGGFSLIEVMVALVVCAIGLLGLAKMESLALASTNVAGSRSIAAIEASSLAAAMHANPGFWADGFAPASFTVQYTSGVPALNGLATTSAVCTTAGANSCAPSVMASYDVQKWAAGLAQVLPGYLATVTCSVNGFPVTCTIQIQWVENAVAANAQQSNIGAISTSSTAAPTYTLFVQP